MEAQYTYTETLVIYYVENTNTFEDEYGNTENSVVDIMTYDDMLYYKKEGGTYYRDINGVSYEIVFPLKGEDRILYYNENLNIMVDEYQEEFFNIFSLITPNELFMFKKNKENMIIRTISGGWIELVYGEEIDYGDEDSDEDQ